MSDEDEDAQPLDDEFAVMLSRRNTTQGPSEDRSSGRTRTPSGKRSGGSHNSTRTGSSKSIQSPSGKSSQRSVSSKSLAPFPPLAMEEQPEPPSISDLRREEEQIAQEEELEVRHKREVAQRLALEKGLSSHDTKNSVSEDVKPERLEEEGDDVVLGGGAPERDHATPISSSPTNTQEVEEPEATFSSRADFREGKDPT